MMPHFSVEPTSAPSSHTAPFDDIDLERQSTAVNPAPHAEHHTKHGAVVRDTIIGFADGLTVPFALTAGLSSIGSARLVILGGLAELFAGAISMGLGGYLAAVTERKHYQVEEAREKMEVNEKPEAEEEEIYEIFAEYKMKREVVRPFVEHLKTDKETWVRFMMDFELRLEKPETSRAWISAVVMGLSYFFGGLVPMIPYFALHQVNYALFASIGITVVMLLSFGYVKAIFTGTDRKTAVWSALQTLFVGVLAASSSYGIVRGINAIHPVSV
ncbi:vacuolar iron transporter [Mytilinidion resinicola]|uniref:Vacuolar iron transporter n=1 Tax=Mytilinidion resinicola TaxID=574789 RepID=A0A6A6Z4H7_9PEZI|nr:vacuolar iron transporter [Mytilinidion resinicola]KAF2815157.1 vacuolar iron transporter [Mytilinidion resinicola]